MLHFLGNGACFYTQAGNNACYYKNKNHILFVDCGESIFERIIQKKLLNGVTQIDILITHMHSDHIGSLPSLLFFCEYALHIIPTVIYPDEEVMTKYLLSAGNEPEKFIVTSPEKYLYYKVIELKQEHSQFIDAYGYLITIEDNLIYYSGDAHTISKDILSDIEKYKIMYVYQDVTRFHNIAHMHVETLANLVSKDNRKQIFCMHFDDEQTKQLAQQLGFSITTVE